MIARRFVLALRSTSVVAPPLRWHGSLRQGLLTLALAVFGCSDHSTPTELHPSCQNIAGSWEEVSDTTCNGTRRSFVVVTQSACSFEVDDASLQAHVSGVITGATASVTLTWFGCTGSAQGTATLQPDAVSGTFSGASNGTSAWCCGPVSGTFRWVR